MSGFFVEKRKQLEHNYSTHRCTADHALCAHRLLQIYFALLFQIHLPHITHARCPSNMWSAFINVLDLSPFLVSRQNEECIPHFDKSFIGQQDMSRVQGGLPGRDDGQGGGRGSRSPSSRSGTSSSSSSSRDSGGGRQHGERHGPDLRERSSKRFCRLTSIINGKIQISSDQQ